MDNLSAECNPFFLVCACIYRIGEARNRSADVLLEFLLSDIGEIGTVIVVAATVEENAIDIILREVANQSEEEFLHLIVGGIEEFG